MKINLFYSYSIDLNVDLIQKIPLRALPRMVFHQMSEHSGFTKLTHKTNYHTQYYDGISISEKSFE